MPSLLLVTTVCRGDIALAYKRLDWMKSLGMPMMPKDILLVNDGSLPDAEFKKLGAAHVQSGLFPKVELRAILQGPEKPEWPWTVNHAWRTTALIVAGEYGLRFDGAEYYCWFYFEPDVTPLNKDFAQILETQYVFHKRQFMGRIHTTRTSTGHLIQHMNGAACYPIANSWYNERMMLTDGVPWDVAGMATNNQPERLADVPEAAYAVHVGCRGFTTNGSTLKAQQTDYTGKSELISFDLAQQILHHGCKDGSLIDVLSLRNGASGEPTTGTLGQPSETPGIQAPPKIKILPTPGNPVAMLKRDVELRNKILVDKAGGMTYKKLLGKYKLNPKRLSYLLNNEPCESTKLTAAA